MREKVEKTLNDFLKATPLRLEQTTSLRSLKINSILQCFIPKWILQVALVGCEINTLPSQLEIITGLFCIIVSKGPVNDGVVAMLTLGL